MERAVATSAKSVNDGSDPNFMVPSVQRTGSALDIFLQRKREAQIEADKECGGV